MKISEVQKEIHETAREKGFYDRPVNIGEKLMLVVSELGEAVEAHRKNKFSETKTFLTNREKLANSEYNNSQNFKAYIKDSFEDEIADAMIRLLDLSEHMKIDLEFHIKEKMKFNATREKLHGKTY